MKKWIGRVAPRALIGLLLTGLAFAVMQPLTELTGEPLVMKVFEAVAVFCWLRFSVWALRLAIQPGIDVQKIAMAAAATPIGAAVIYVAVTFDNVVCLLVTVWLLKP